MNISDIDIVDFHAHILPEADHGSASVEESNYQLQRAHEVGVTRIIATPHFYPHLHTLDSFLKRRETAYNKLISNIQTNAEIRLGAEVLLCDNLHKLDGLSSLCVYGTNCLLLELPYDGFSASHVHAVKRLVSMGYEVVIAHADRYEPENVEALIDFGVELQLNASALVARFGDKHLFKWLERELVVALGSDIHGSDRNAYKKFFRAKKRIEKYLPNIAKESNKIWDRSCRI